MLFVDLVGSTSLVASADPEVVRRRISRFFDEVALRVETHGGIVEKFAGDAVLAAFGVRVTHEDDAERAIRAAFAILDQVRELGLEARVGIEAGEVVVDESESTFATGEAVNVAARLQQQAAPGEILIGPGARSLTAGRIETEDMGALELKGLTEPFVAWRAVCAGDGSRHLSNLAAPLIGRDWELELLGNTHSRTVRDGRAHLFTIYGEPGVGKSRLAREFVDSLEGTTILSGRCLPYGEGITYWPLAEMVKAAAGITDDDPLEEAFAKLRACCEDEAVADLLGLASGLLEALESDRSPQEIAWATREFAAKLADAQPVVLVFEDIQWAEEPLLELIEHLADWVRAPLVLLCLARPELLEVRPGWGGGRVRSTAIELEALGAEDSEALVDALLAGDDGELPAEVRLALLEKTEGNPLFVEETIRMFVERGGDSGVERIPDTLQALIAARIDRLPGSHRALLRRAAVIGRVFWRGAIAHLSPDVEDVDSVLEDLHMRDFLLLESRSSISGEQAYRFKHVLIREVSYSGLSKSARADHHARFAAWLREHAREELLEIRAYHLDQAVTLLVELDGEAPSDLSADAAEALFAAGKRALGREANRSARNLLLRAAELEPTLQRRYQAAVAAWRLTDLPAVQAEMENVRALAEEAGDTELEGRALTVLAGVVMLRDVDLPKAKELTERALEVLVDSKPGARYDALVTRAQIAWWHGDVDENERFLLEALDVVRKAGLKHLESIASHKLAGVYKARLELDRIEPYLRRSTELAEESGSISARAASLCSWANLHYLRGELADAERRGEEARTLYTEAGSAWELGRIIMFLAWVAKRKGDLPRAERLARESIRTLKPLEDRGALCEAQRALAEVLVAQGKLDEAERHALAARETVGTHDVASVATTTFTLGVVRAAQGRDEQAESLMTTAVATIAETGFREIEVELLEGFAQFLRERGREDEAAPLSRRLLELAPVAALGSAFESTAQIA